MSRMNDELSHLVGRKVDVIEQIALRNPFRRREILASRKIIRKYVFYAKQTFDEFLVRQRGVFQSLTSASLRSASSSSATS
jgi:hypothetical protein